MLFKQCRHQVFTFMQLKLLVVVVVGVHNYTPVSGNRNRECKVWHCIAWVASARALSTSLFHSSKQLPVLSVVSRLY